MTSGIYIIRHRESGKVYVGSSTDIEYRWWYHRVDLQEESHHNQYLQRAWTKFGEESFDFEVLEKCVDETLREREIFWIEFLGSLNSTLGYNLAIDPRNPMRGRHHSEETKAKMSRAHQGRTVSKETRERLRRSHLGHSVSPETREKLRQYRLGTTHSEETKEKMRKAKLRRRNV